MQSVLKKEHVTWRPDIHVELLGRTCWWTWGRLRRCATLYCMRVMSDDWWATGPGCSGEVTILPSPLHPVPTQPPLLPQTSLPVPTPRWVVQRLTTLTRPNLKACDVAKTRWVGVSANFTTFWSYCILPYRILNHAITMFLAFGDSCSCVCLRSLYL